jgi:hypothetical protein
MRGLYYDGNLLKEFLISQLINYDRGQQEGNTKKTEVKQVGTGYIIQDVNESKPKSNKQKIIARAIAAGKPKKK